MADELSTEEILRLVQEHLNLQNVQNEGAQSAIANIISRESLNNTIRVVLQQDPKLFFLPPEFMALRYELPQVEAVSYSEQRHMGRFTPAEYVAIWQLLQEYYLFQDKIQGGDIYNDMFLNPLRNSIHLFTTLLAQIAYIRENFEGKKMIQPDDKLRIFLPRYKEALEKDGMILGVNTVRILRDQLSEEDLMKDLPTDILQKRDEFNELTANLYLQCLGFAQEAKVSDKIE